MLPLSAIALNSHCPSPTLTLSLRRVSVTGPPGGSGQPAFTKKVETATKKVETAGSNAG
jgi:hypothetical protein